MSDAKMNTGVEIILQRMKDCPEDFEYNPREGMTRWSRLIDHAIGNELLTEEEQRAIQDGLKETRRQKFTESVMKQLAGEDEAGDEGKSPYQQPSVTLSGGATQGVWGSSSIHKTQAELQLEMMQHQQLIAMQAQQAYNSYPLQSSGTGQSSYVNHTGASQSFLSKLFHGDSK